MCRTVAVFLVTSLGVWAAQRKTPTPQVPMPAEFRNRAPEPGATLVGQWWKGFEDPVLDELIERAGRANLDIRKAASRLAEANANRKVSRSALLPDITVSASAGELRGGFNQGVIKAPAAGGPQSGNLLS